MCIRDKINGIIYVLIIKKCPKIGTQFIIPAIYGLYLSLIHI